MKNKIKELREKTYICRDLPIQNKKLSTFVWKTSWKTLWLMLWKAVDNVNIKKT